MRLIANLRMHGAHACYPADRMYGHPREGAHDLCNRAVSGDVWCKKQSFPGLLQTARSVTEEEDEKDDDKKIRV